MYATMYNHQVGAIVVVTVW